MTCRDYENRRWNTRYLAARWGPGCAARIVGRRLARSMAVMARSHAGRTILEVLQTLDRFTGGTPVDWAHGILAIEDEAARDALMALRAKVADLPEFDQVEGLQPLVAEWDVLALIDAALESKP
jgi:hypothetical protein